ncbi:glycoside hydrolase family 19 protein [Flavobacterium lacisediminis]|uniref:T9SS type A sorting domain-containing protein n=1 Tax=Flavobacterium lacisediminis TaxID=2989705 RepID=A0ABT3EK94_9FLAO|nr:glycoside hydrolase family 19 protein [Flavobacterium lacisediminis]MCW1148831.1 T9SS type A sorting domain-containing protein [Flavobacterium lacisediminis]
MRIKLLAKTVFLFLIVCTEVKSQSVSAYSVDDLLTASLWNSLFPKRAGTYGVHPQGYAADFYSYANFNQAVTEMSDYLVQIRKKQGVWGELVTITKKSTSVSYVYSDVESWWYSNSTPETVINIDFADFVNRSSLDNNKRELSAFLANISKETTGGWQLPVGGGLAGDYAQWGLYFVHEVGYSSATSAGVYSQAHAVYPPNPTKGYYGRGPIQLSWNYNYGQLSKFLYNDGSVLLNNPDLVQEDGVLAFKSAIWFWMMPQCPKPSCHQVMHELWVPQSGEYTENKMYKKGFAHTNNIINGGLECRSASTAAFTEKVVLRSELYKYYLDVLGFSVAQISLEDTGDYSTLCYESSINAMQDYINCAVVALNTSDFIAAELLLYPNPAKNQITIESDTMIQGIEIFNVLGQMQFNNEGVSGSVVLDLSSFKKGSYFIRIYVNDTVVTRTFVVN